MENKKDIGAFLKSKLDETTKAPNESLWEKINASLDRKEKRRKRVFLLLFPTIAVLGILAFVIFQDTDKPFLNEKEKFSVEEIKGDLEENILNEKSTKESASEVKIENKTGEDDKDKIAEVTNRVDGNKIPSKNGKTKYANSTKAKNEFKISGKTEDISDSKTTKSTENVTNESLTNSPENDSKITVAKVDCDSIPENDSIKIDSTALAKMEKIKKKRKKQSEKDSTEIQKTNNPKWTVMAIGGPVLFEVSKKTSAIDQSLDGTETSGKLTFAYGVGVGFNLNENLSISYAAVRTKLDYTVKNIPSSTTQDLSRIHSFSAIAGQNKVTSEEFSAFTGNDETVNLRQEIEYIEMPLQLTYSLTDSRFGAHVFGGFSTFLLTEDAIYVENSRNEKLDLGSANNLSKINFSVNAGFGAYYKLSDKFTVEINPTFKYHFKLLDSASRNTSGFLLGFYAGIKYNLNTK